MHGSDVMAAAVYAARASPSRLQSHHHHHHHHQSIGLTPHLQSLALPHPLHPIPQVSGVMEQKQLMYHPGFPDSHHHLHPPHYLPPLHLQHQPSSIPYSSVAPAHLPPSTTATLSSLASGHHLPLPSRPSLHSHPPPSSHHSGGYSEVHDDDNDEFVDEDVDEDDMSDLEKQFQEELLAIRNRQHLLQQQQQQQQDPDMTRQLLEFADMVNGDIHKFFGRKKGDEESCDIYEDKWVATKSGRELYYADLLRMAQGDFGDSKSSKKSASSKIKDCEPLEDNVNSFSGKADASLGLGGLETLFDLGGRKKEKSKHPLSSSSSSACSSSISSDVSHNGGNRKQRGQGDNNGGAHELPMSQRKLPASFWREPSPEAEDADEHVANSSGGGGDGIGVGAIVTNTPSSVSDSSSSSSSPPTSSSALPPTSSVLHSLSKLPDFSDLIENWHGGILGGGGGDHPQHHPHHPPSLLQHHHHQQQQQQHYQLHQLQQQQQLHQLHQLQASVAAATGSFASPLSSGEAGKKRRI